MEACEREGSREEAMEIDKSSLSSTTTVDLLRKFLSIQQRRAEAYAKLRRGFSDYVGGGGESEYQQLCGEITVEFNDCSKQVLDMESQFLNPEICRNDLADLLKAVQEEEKKKLQLTVKIQLLKKAGRPSERLVNHNHCRFRTPKEHLCMHVHEITEDEGTADAEADAEYDGALKNAIMGLQDAVTNINEHLEEVRYEINDLENLPQNSRE